MGGKSGGGFLKEIILRNGQQNAVKVMSENKRVVVYPEQRGLGASFLLEAFGSVVASHYPNNTVAFCAINPHMIKCHIDRIINEPFIERNEICDLRRNRIKLKNGSQILFFVEYNEYALHSTSVDLLLIDDGYLIKDDERLARKFRYVKSNGGIISVGRPFGFGWKSTRLYNEDL